RRAGPVQRGRWALQEREVRRGGDAVPLARRGWALAARGPVAVQPGQRALSEAGLPRRHPGLSRRARAQPGRPGRAAQSGAGAASPPGAAGAAEEAATTAAEPEAGPEGPEERPGQGPAAATTATAAAAATTTGQTQVGRAARGG